MKIKLTTGIAILGTLIAGLALANRVIDYKIDAKVHTPMSILVQIDNRVKNIETILMKGR